MFTYSYPDATEEELQADDVCIICRESMTTAAKKLPCNHIFHTSCLRSWFQRQQTCPTCRRDVLRTVPIPTQTTPPPPPPQPAQPQPPQNSMYGCGCGWVFRERDRESERERCISICTKSTLLSAKNQLCYLMVEE